MNTGGNSSLESGLEEPMTLREVTNEARDKVMQDIIDQMKKQMETLATILYEFRDRHRKKKL